MALFLPTAPAVANPPSGDVTPGQTLPFTAGPGDLSVLFDNRANCGSTPVSYRLVVTAPLQGVFPNPQDNDPDGSFSFSLTASADVGFIFPVDVSISGTCGVISAYSASGRLGLYRIVAGSAQPPPLTDAQHNLGEVSGLAGSFAEHLKKFLNLKFSRESGKLRKRVDRLVRDGKEAKRLRGELRQLGVPEEGEIVYPCPAGRAAKRACPGGEIVEKLEDLYGFLESLKELARYPEYQRKKADEYYQTQEGQARMDALTNLCGDCGGKTKYSQLNEKQKQIIASQIQVHSGAVRKALRDAQKAGRAGTEVAY